MRRRLLTVAGLLGVAGPVWAQPATPDSARSTRAGVYSAAQADLGSEVYFLSCVSCHTAVSHTGGSFAAKWGGRPLSDLFEYIRGSMPKSEPGSLTPREYARVLAYMLRMNGMPAGPDELPADSTALARIRIEFKPSQDSTPKR